MKPEQLMDAMHDLDEELLLETEAIRQSPRGRKVIPFRQFASVAGLGLVLGISLLAGSVLNRSLKDTSGSVSEGATESACEEGTADTTETEHAGEEFKEEETDFEATPETMDSENKLESVADKTVSDVERSYFANYDTDIFRGTVLGTRLVHLNGDEESLPRIVATIRLSKVYRGSLAPGDTITLIAGKQAKVSNELTDSVTCYYIEPGMRGIFMVVPSEEKRIEADYELPDDRHFAFLDTDQGLIFERDTYTSISDAQTLDDIESYIYTMLQPNP